METKTEYVLQYRLKYQSDNPLNEWIDYKKKVTNNFNNVEMLNKIITEKIEFNKHINVESRIIERIITEKVIENKEE